MFMPEGDASANRVMDSTTGIRRTSSGVETTVPSGGEEVAGRRTARSMYPRDPPRAPTQIQRVGKANTRMARSKAHAAKPSKKLTVTT